MPSSCKPHFYGVLHSGRTVDAWMLTGEGGLTVEFLTYGGIVTRLLAPDRNGKLGDVVLGLSSLDE